MISLIAGQYKGRKLFNYKNNKIRPSQAKIRKSVFQILEPFSGLYVLDLYAGIGTLGFEALSRGASKVVFVEKDRSVFKILQKNKNFFNNDKIELYLLDVCRFIKSECKHRFDIIFADPPYNYNNYENLRSLINQWLNPNGVFCMEMSKRYIPEPYEKIKYYGNTQVVFWKSDS